MTSITAAGETPFTWIREGSGQTFTEPEGGCVYVRPDGKGFTWRGYNSRHSLIVRQDAPDETTAKKHAETWLYSLTGDEDRAGNSRRFVCQAVVDVPPHIGADDVGHRVTQALGQLSGGNWGADVAVTFTADTGNPDDNRHCLYCSQPGDDTNLAPFNHAGNLACRDTKACKRRQAAALLPRHLAAARTFAGADRDMRDLIDGLDHLLWLLGLPGADEHPEFD